MAITEPHSKQQGDGSPASGPADLIRARARPGPGRAYTWTNSMPVTPQNAFQSAA